MTHSDRHFEYMTSNLARHVLNNINNLAHSSDVTSKTLI
jgi:hypothetical protein